MFARFCVILSLIIAADYTLPNGIRVSALPPNGDRFELVLGYEAGVRNESRALSGSAAIVSQYLASTPAARSLSLNAYAAGGEVQFLNELDRTAIRISVPQWAKSMVLEQVAQYLAETPGKHAELIARSRAGVLKTADDRSQFRSRIEDEIRIGLLGSHPYHHPIQGWKSDIEQISTEDITRFFNENYGTDRAFALMTGPVPQDLSVRLGEVQARSSRKLPESAVRVNNAERTLRFVSEEPAGAVVFASPIPGVFYRAWYSVLMLDRLVRRSVPGAKTALFPTLDPYYWRLEVPVPSGQFAEAAEESLVQEINRLQFSRASSNDLEMARQAATDFLNINYVREWFASHDLEDRRREGLQWVQSFTADDMRAAARDLLVMNRIIASWSPKARQRTVEIENLSAGSGRPADSSIQNVPLDPIPISPFPPHVHTTKSFAPPERLSSGVWLAESSRSAVFLSGPEVTGLPEGDRREGPNGTVWSFRVDPDAAIIQAFQKYRANRILVLAPPASIERARSLWSALKGSDRDATVISPQGNVPNIAFQHSGIRSLEFT